MDAFSLVRYHTNIRIAFIAGFGSGLKKKLVEKLKKWSYSVIIDETTNVTVDSQLAVMVQYWDKAEFDVLDFVKCTDATADGLQRLLLSAP